MPLILPKQRAVTREANFSGQPATTWGTALASDTSAHTFPAAYTDLIASTTYDSDWVNIWFHTNVSSNTNTASLVSIYIGAAAAEQPLIPYLAAGWVQTVSVGSNEFRRYSFPLHVPAGSRLSARHQSVRTSTNVYCMIELLGGGRSDHWTGTQVEAVGVDTANSRGTLVTPGGASEGTLTSLGTNTYEWGYVLPIHQGNTDGTAQLCLTAFDIGSSNSVVIGGLEDFLSGMSSSEYTHSLSGGRFCTVPASTTLHLRAQSLGGVEARDFIIYGVF